MQLILAVLSMRCLSIINVYSTGLMSSFERSKIIYYSRVYSTLLSIFLSKDEFLMLEGSDSGANVLNTKCNSSKFNEYEELSIGRKCVSKYVMKYSLLNYDQKVDDYMMKKIIKILTNRGWNFSSPSSCEIDLNQYNIISLMNDIFEESRDAELVLYFFNWTENYRGSKYMLNSVCRMIHILVSGNMNHKAMDLVHDLIRDFGEEKMCKLLFIALCKTSTERSVLQIVYNMLVNCYIMEKMVSVAFKVACQMDHLNMFPSVRTCNSLLRALVQSNQLELALNFLDNLLRRGMSLNTYIIGLFIHKYCSEGNLGMAWKFLMSTKQCGIQPDVVSYSIIIHSLCKMSCLVEATSLLFKMTQLSISPDSVLISSIIDGHCKMGQVEKGINILKIFNFPPDNFMFNSFISKLCIDGKMKEACALLYEMSESGLLPNFVNYNTIIGGYCKTKNINKAYQYLGILVKKGIKPSVFTYVMFIDSYCKSGKMELAESLFEKIITDGLHPDIVAFSALLDGYGKMRLLQKVFEILVRMKSFNVCPDVVTYNTLIHILVTMGFVNEAKDVFEELIEKGFSPNVVTFTTVIDGLSKAGNFEEAFLLWLYLSEHHVQPDVVICCALLNGYCRARRMEEANALFHKMLDIGLHLDVRVYNILLHGYCKIGNMNDACNLITKMVGFGILPNDVTHRALTLGFEKKGVNYPAERAAFKLQEILLGFCVDVNIDNYVGMTYQ